MRWQDTTAYECRWSEFAEELVYDHSILWEDSEADYQGRGELLAEKDGKFVYCCWYYGSCGGCDPWEGMPKEQVREEFRNDCVEYFDSILDVERWASVSHKKLSKELQKRKEEFEEQFRDDFETYNVH